MSELLLALILAAGPLLPKKQQAHRLAVGGKITLTLAQLEKRAQLLVKGPAVLVCAAERKDDRGARVELDLPGVTQETLNLIPVAAGLVFIDLPKGPHTIDLSAWSLAGAAGSAVVSLHMPGYRPPPLVIAQPSSQVVRKVDGNDGVQLLSKLPTKNALDDAPFWELTPQRTATFRVTGPRTVSFEARRLIAAGKEAQPSRVLFLRNGQAMMSALLHGARVDPKPDGAPSPLRLGDLEALDVEVPDGSHVLSLRVAEAPGVLLRLRR